MPSSNSRAVLALVLPAAEHDVLHGLSRLEGDGGLGSGEHAAELRDLARQQAVHDASDAALEQAEARRVLDLMLQPAQAVRGNTRAGGLPAEPPARSVWGISS